jgi:hypothetical protein
MTSATAPITARCDGCKHCHWIAPGGQLWRDDPKPQMHCLVLGRLEVVASARGDYVHTLIPKGCPQHAQPGLF